MAICLCGCGESYTPSKWTKRPRYIFGHYARSVQGKATAAKGGRRGAGASKRRPSWRKVAA